MASAKNFWFLADDPPYEGKWLSLNPYGKTNRLVNHVAVLTNISKDYAADGRSIIAVNVLEPNAARLIARVLSEAETLYGRSVRFWKLLRIDELTKDFELALPGSTTLFPS